MSSDPPRGDVEALFARFVEGHVRDGVQIPIAELCAGREELVEPLRRCIERYLQLDATLDRGGSGAAPSQAAPLPEIHGFEVIERIGTGGMGEVFKLRDRKLDRIVAGKVLRADSRARGLGWKRFDCIGALKEIGRFNIEHPSELNQPAGA